MRSWRPNTKREHKSAEADRDNERAQQAELRLIEHANSCLQSTQIDLTLRLPKRNGALSLTTSEPGAEVLLEKYVLHNRRLIANPVKVTGPEPSEFCATGNGQLSLANQEEGLSRGPLSRLYRPRRALGCNASSAQPSNTGLVATFGHARGK